MTIRRLVVFAAGASALVALVPANPVAAQRTSPCAGDPVCRFVDENIGIKSAASLMWLRQFARLDGEVASPVKNVHVAAQIDSVHELRFPGLMIQVYAPRGGAPLLQQILVASSRYRLPMGLKFGMSTIEDVQRALGVPKEVEHLGGIL